MGVIKPVLESEFSLSKTQLGFMDVSFLLPYALIQLFGSSVADKLGSRLCIALCLAGEKILAIVKMRHWYKHMKLAFILIIF